MREIESTWSWIFVKHFHHAGQRSVQSWGLPKVDWVVGYATPGSLAAAVLSPSCHSSRTSHLGSCCFLSLSVSGVRNRKVMLTLHDEDDSRERGSKHSGFWWQTHLLGICPDSVLWPSNPRAQRPEFSKGCTLPDWLETSSFPTRASLYLNRDMRRLPQSNFDNRSTKKKKDEFCEGCRHPEGLQAEQNGAGAWASDFTKPVNINSDWRIIGKLIYWQNIGFLFFNTSFCRFGGAVKSSNMTPPWGTSAPWSSLETSSETSSERSGPFNWNSSNAARYEQGTTFYSQVRQGKWWRGKQEVEVEEEEEEVEEGTCWKLLNAAGRLCRASPQKLWLNQM